MEIKKYTEANRVAWNEATPYHMKAKKDEWYGAFARPGYSCLDEVVTGVLNDMDISGKDIAQLGCNNGRELISLKNMGGRECVGFDICDAAVEEARQLAAHANAECEFVRTDIYDIPDKFNDSFDLIYMSIGFLTWLPDLARFMERAARLLRKEGIMLIYDAHPFLHMFDCDKKDDPLKVRESYFKDEPWEDFGSLDYYGLTPYDGTVKYNFAHKLSDIINGFLRNRLRIFRFEEYEHDISVCYQYLETTAMRLPLSFLIAGKKE